MSTSGPGGPGAAVNPPAADDTDEDLLDAMRRRARVAHAELIATPRPAAADSLEPQPDRGQHAPTCHDIDPDWRQRIPARASFPYNDPRWTQPLLPRYSIDEPGTVDCDWNPWDDPFI